MLEIEYELTLDDELDAFFATQKFKGKLPFFRWDTEYIFLQPLYWVRCHIYCALIYWGLIPTQVCFCIGLS